MFVKYVQHFIGILFQGIIFQTLHKYLFYYCYKHHWYTYLKCNRNGHHGQL